MKFWDFTEDFSFHRCSLVGDVQVLALLQQTHDSKVGVEAKVIWRYLGSRPEAEASLSSGSATGPDEMR